VAIFVHQCAAQRMDILVVKPVRLPACLLVITTSLALSEMCYTGLRETRMKGGPAMKLINLAEQPFDITHVLELAQEGPVVLLAADGREYILAEADDFDREVEQLRNSVAFQRFLDERSAYQTTKRRIPLDEIRREIEVELAAQQASDSNE